MLFGTNTDQSIETAEEDHGEDEEDSEDEDSEDEEDGENQEEEDSEEDNEEVVINRWLVEAVHQHKEGL